MTTLAQARAEVPEGVDPLEFLTQPRMVVDASAVALNVRTADSEVHDDAAWRSLSASVRGGDAYVPPEAVPEKSN